MPENYGIFNTKIKSFYGGWRRRRLARMFFFADRCRLFLCRYAPKRASNCSYQSTWSNVLVFDAYLHTVVCICTCGKQLLCHSKGLLLLPRRNIVDSVVFVYDLWSTLPLSTQHQEYVTWQYSGIMLIRFAARTSIQTDHIQHFGIARVYLKIEKTDMLRLRYHFITI